MNSTDTVCLTAISARCRTVGLTMVIILLGGCAATGPQAPPTAGQGQIDDALRAEFASAVELKRAGEILEAEARFLALNQTHPELAGPLANLGIIALDQDDPTLAETYFLQVISRHPDHAHALNYLGVLAREQGNFEQAERYYRQALAGNPDFQPALKNLAILLELYQGRLDEALVLVERYQTLQDEVDPTLDGWIFDLKNRMH